jgi:hypothetical protein
MFITENQNFGDSVLFLMAARTSLSNIIDEHNTENAPELISFIQNEASDYQVMNLLLCGKLPEEKYNLVEEAMLFSHLKESMLMNKDFVTEMVGEEIFDNVLNEVDSLYMATSTTRPVLEFAAQTDPTIAIACMITENPAGDALMAKNLKAKIMNLASDARDAAGPAKEKIMQQIAAAKSKLAAVGQAAKSKGAAMAGKMTGNTAAQKAGLQKAAAASPAQHAKLVAKQKAHAAQAKLGSMKGANTAIAKHKAGVAAGKVKGAASAAGKAVGTFAKTKAGMATGGAAAAALAIYAGYKIYKRFFSQAAKACAGQSGAAKSACMAKYKKQAIMKQASAIQSASSTCAKAKDPAKCKAAVGKKVAQLKAKAAKISA